MIIYDPKITGSFQINGSTISSVGEIDNLSGSVAALNNASSSYLLNTTDVLNGNLTVTGTLTAQEFHTEFVSASIIYKSGSTKFGDTSDDTHSFTGGTSVNGNFYVDNTSTGTNALYIRRNTSDTEALKVWVNDYGPIFESIQDENTGTFGSMTFAVDAGATNPIFTFTDGVSGPTLFEVKKDDRAYFKDNVGIGTASPAAKLHVLGTTKLEGATTVTGGTLTTTSNINAGGSITAAASGYIELKADQTDTAAVRLGVSSGDLEAFVIADNTGAGHIVGNTSFKVMGYSSSTLTEYARFTPTGLGIGTNNPNYTLEVNGTAKIDSTLTIADSGAAVSYLYLLSSPTGESELRMGDTDTDAGSIAYNNNTDTMVFRAGAANRVYINSSGNVGIGETSPAYKLQVNGDMRITSNVRLGTGLDTTITIGQAQNSQPTSSDTKLILSGKNLEAGGTYYGDYGQLLFNATSNYTGSARKWLLTNSLDAYKFSLIMGDSGQVTPTIGTAGGVSGGSPVITVDDGARVGLGTTSPSQKLHIVGNSYTTGYAQAANAVMKTYTSGGTGYAMFGSNSAVVPIAIGRDSSYLDVVLDTAGNLGINRTSPLYKLHVEGDAGVNSLILSNSSTSTFGTMVKTYQDYIKRSFVLNYSFTFTGAGTYYFNLAFPTSGGFGWNLRLVTGRSGNWRNFGYIDYQGYAYWEPDGDFRHEAQSVDIASSYGGGITVGNATGFGANNLTDTSEGTTNYSYYIVRIPITFPDNTTGSDGYFKVHLDTFGYGGDTAYFLNA